jgi:ribose-phosphate pyrophosphokinase
LFPDGERYQRLTDRVRGEDVLIVGGTPTDSDAMELYDLACGISHYGANSLTLVVPYFGYATMERALKPGEIITAKTRALMLSSIPEARTHNEIVLVDLHTAGTEHYFEGHLRPFHIYSRRLVAEIVREQSGFPENMVVASTDAGRAKWVEALANDLGIEAAFVYKRRLSGSETKIRGINADVAGKHVVIYDDMIRTGGSLIKAAQAYKDAGADQITAITTHGILPGESLSRLQKSGLFNKLFSTDTHPHARALGDACSDGFLEVRTMADDIADYLLRMDHEIV